VTDIGLIETVRVHHGEAPLWKRHLGRLTRSALDLGLPIPDLMPPRGGDDRIVRFEVGKDAVSVSERPVESADQIRLVVVPSLHAGYAHKTTDRGWLEAARAAATAQGADDALLLDREGRVVEASRWAVGWWTGERLCFPPLTLGGLPSVARHALERVVRGGIFQETITGPELAQHSVLACNAARGVVAVEMLDGLPLVPSHRTSALTARFWEAQRA
jgi:branched-subunit amino acid aminotransferase/4-amino-4-deoxychorismate lyase